MKKLWLFGLLMGLSGLAHANDSAVSGVGGSWKRLDKEHSSVRMVSEVVDIVVHDKKIYDTTAQFVFKNEGPKQIVKMGFPESGYGDTSGKSTSSYQRFKTSVDGVPFKATRRLDAGEDDEFTALWIKSVPFRAGQTRHIKVSYRSELGQTAPMPPQWWAQYDFTGGNWRGKVAKSVLTVTMERPGTYLLKFYSEKSKPDFKRIGNQFRFEWRNWEAESSFQFRLFDTLRNWVSPSGGIVGLGNGFDGEYNDGLPVNIDLPGKTRDETTVDFPAPGVVHGGELFLNLRSWLDAQPEKSTSSTYDPKAKTVLVTKFRKFLRVTKGQQGVFTVVGSEGENIYVPARLITQAFGGTAGYDLKSHKLMLANG